MKQDHEWNQNSNKWDVSTNVKMTENEDTIIKSKW
jgi:hypothetical protein